MSKARTRIAGLALYLFCVFVISAEAQDDTVKVPNEVKPFIGKGMIPIALETGDLNADGKKDFILVLSEPIAENAPYEEGAGARQTMILVRNAAGILSVGARNDDVVMCKNCGGVLGDPFAGVRIKGTRFTISNYGGSNDRWAYDYTFDYSRRDKTWQLVRVEETSFHALDPVKSERRRVYTPPKNFGLINFADFEPENYQGKGKK